MPRSVVRSRAGPPGGPDGPAVSLGVLEEVIGFKLRRIQNYLARSFYEGLDRRQLRPGGFTALALISANPGMSQTELGRQIGFDKAIVVALLDSLEGLGWTVRRRSADDRRRHELHTTEAGEAALAELVRFARSNETHVREALTVEERQQLFALLDKVYAACYPAPGEAEGA